MATVKYTIDAAGRSLGRVATEAASKLLGKATVDQQQKHMVADVAVEIVNASRIRTTPKKLKEQGTYKRYSGYPGGLKLMTLTDIIDKKGWPEAVRIAVKGMLPKNKLQNQRMKRLTVND